MPDKRNRNNGRGQDEMPKDGSYRTALLQYVKKKYKTKPDYPWKGDPESAVLRHEDNRKWYGLLMEVDRAKLGLPGQERVWAINVKTRDQMFHDMLIRQPGYFPGYHMNKEKWITIILDGTVPFDEVCGMIDASYEATASRKKQQKLRPPKECSRQSPILQCGTGLRERRSNRLETGRRHPDRGHGLPVCGGAGVCYPISVQSHGDGYPVPLPG